MCWVEGVLLRKPDTLPIPVNSNPFFLIKNSLDYSVAHKCSFILSSETDFEQSDLKVQFTNRILNDW